MVHRLKATLPARVALALAWTATLAAALYVTDRVLLGADRGLGWVEVADVAHIPARSGSVLTPAYLPDRVEWPPARIFYREPPRAGWWLGMRPRGGHALNLWIGLGAAPPPAALGDAASCLSSPQRACPSNWRLLSKSQDGAGTVFVLTTLEPEQAARVLHGLARAR